MNAIEELEAGLTLNQAQHVSGFNPSYVGERPSSTQQLLDELLGRFEDDGSSMVLSHALTSDFHADSEE